MRRFHIIILSRYLFVIVRHPGKIIIKFVTHEYNSVGVAHARPIIHTGIL